MKKIHIGKNVLSGKSINIPLEALMNTHTFIVGRSGVGKSCFLEILARAIIESGYGLVFLDGKGDTFENLQRFVANKRLGSKTFLMDPSDDGHSVGINYLELFGQTSPEALADLVLEGMMKFFKEDTEYKPWLEEWGPASLLPLIKGGFTLLELFPFTSLQDPRFRNALLSKLGSSFYQQKWQELQAFRPQEQANILNVVKTRASKFWTSEPLKYIFGQAKTTINWLKLMKEGGVLLGNLGHNPKLVEKTASFIGTAIVHQLLVNAPLRAKDQRRPVFLVVDEFQKFVCNDFADALDRMRGYGIYLILACQTLSQLSEENPRVYTSVMANCRNKFTFSMSSQDAEQMEKELFDGYRHEPQIKHETWQTKLRPIETTREITSEGSGHVRGSFSGMASGASISDMTGSSIMLSEGSVLTNSSSQSHGSAFSSSQTRGESDAFSESQTKARVPWYEYEEYQELTGIIYYSLDEIKERYKAWIANQDDRHLQMKLGSKRPIPLITADLKEIRSLPSWLNQFREEVFAKTALPVPQVEKEIEGRVTRFLKAADDDSHKISEVPKSFRVPKKKREPKS